MREITLEPIRIDVTARDQLRLADFLEELAVFASPESVLAPEIAHHMCQALRHGHLARMGLQELDSSLRRRRYAKIGAGRIRHVQP
jgi:hypothetical protein